MNKVAKKTEVAPRKDERIKRILVAIPKVSGTYDRGCFRMVYQHPETESAVVSNGAAMLLSKAFYVKAYRGKCIDPIYYTHEAVRRERIKYPDFSSMLKDRAYKKTANLTLVPGDFRGIDRPKAFERGRSRQVLFFENKGELYFTQNSPVVPGEPVFSLNLNYLAPLVESLTEFVVDYTDENRMVRFREKLPTGEVNPDWTLICMPMKRCL